MLFSVPLFATNTYMEDPTSYDYGLAWIETYRNATPEQFNTTMDIFIKRQRQLPNKLVYVQVANFSWYDPDVDFNEMRDTE